MRATTVVIPGTTTVAERRPWGSWEVLDVGPGYKIKRITVEPHSRLSIQTHVHRAEHWLVVVGLATCTVGENQVRAGAGTHIFVPRGSVHRLANDQAEALIIIEAQVGRDTGEDDIVRLQDDYGRR